MSGLHDVAEAADFFKVSVATVRRRTRAGKVTWPHTRIGDRVLFSDEQLAEIIAMNAVRPRAKRGAA